jgi:hypothetical protein
MRSFLGVLSYLKQYFTIVSIFCRFWLIYYLKIDFVERVGGVRLFWLKGPPLILTYDPLWSYLLLARTAVGTITGGIDLGKDAHAREDCIVL